MKTSITSKTIEQRIMRNIKPGLLFEGTPCWEWQGSKTRTGHGRIGVGGGATYTHRLTFMAKVGPIPKEYDVHHKCENPCCCNPEHLEALTRKEHINKDNRKQSLAAQSQRAAQAQAAKRLAIKHCKRGHEYTPENTYYPPGRNKNGKVERACIICLRNRPSQKAGRLRS